MKKQIATIAVITMAVGVQAQTIVSWGPTTESVTANQNITVNLTFDDSSYQSPTVGPNYNPTAAVANPNFYAAVSHTPSSTFTVFNGANNDLLGRYQTASPLSTVHSLMLAWDVTSTETLGSFTINSIGSFGFLPAFDPDKTLRWLVQDNLGDWYASTAITGMGENVDITSNAGILNWVAYTPHNAGAVTFGAASSPSLTDVQKVGYYYQWTTDGGGGVYASGFQATVIPEPSTFALLGLGSFGLMLARRRR